MDLSASEFADEYQDWIEGQPGATRAAWFDIPVGQLEHERVHALSPVASVRSAIELMSARDCGALVVIDGEQLVGLFTARDAVQRVLSRGLDLDHTPLSTVMTEAPEVLSETTTLAQALRAITRSCRLHVPLVDGRGRPIAMVSIQRILEFLCETFPKEILNAPPERGSGVYPIDGG